MMTDDKEQTTAPNDTSTHILPAGFSRRRMLRVAGAGIVGGALAAGTASGAEDYDARIVFNRSKRAVRASYEFSVTGSVDPDGSVGAIEASDTIDGSRVTGVVDGDADAYLFTGDLSGLQVSGSVDVALEYVDGSESSSSSGVDRLEIVSAPGGSLPYSFTADGEISMVLDNGLNSAEEGNDAVTDNGDGTWSAEGFTGAGEGDTYDLAGDVTAFQPVDADYTLFVNGTQVTRDELLGSNAESDTTTGGTESDTTDGPHVLEIVSAPGGSLPYSFTATGQITMVRDNGDNSAEEGNDAVTDNGDGTWSADGFTGDGMGDTYEFVGDVAAFSPTEGDYTLVLDGTQVAVEELTDGENAAEQTDDQTQSTDADVAIDFDSSASIDEFSRTYRTSSLSFISDSRAYNGTSLRTDIDEGDHYGTSMRYRFTDEGMAEPETLYYQYYVYFPTDFEVVRTGGKLPGPAGTYDTAGWGGRKPDGTNGWSARMAFDQGSDDDHVQVGWYCYHVDMGSWGSRWDWTEGGRGDLEKGEWHCIDGQVTMNTPGENDGVLRGWVDGELAHEKTDVRFRDTTDLKVQDFWFNVYYGGSWDAPSSSGIHFDGLKLSLGSPIGMGSTSSA